MTARSFALIPFAAPGSPPVAVTGSVARRGHTLSWRYALTGGLREIVLPGRSPRPARRAELWKSTCFELFLAVRGQPGYREVNLSPSGDWNVYWMDAYRRQGFREETRIQRLELEVQSTSEALTLSALLDLSPIVRPDEALDIGVAAILQTGPARETYWALAHTGPEPDFHLRESFILELAGRNHPSAQPARGG